MEERRWRAQLRLSFFEEQSRSEERDESYLGALCDTVRAYCDRFVIAVCFTCTSIGTAVSERTMTMCRSDSHCEKGQENEPWNGIAATCPKFSEGQPSPCRECPCRPRAPDAVCPAPLFGLARHLRGSCPQHPSPDAGDGAAGPQAAGGFPAPGPAVGDELLRLADRWTRFLWAN